MLSYYSYDRKAHSVLNETVVDGPTKARQDMKDECDINTIVENFGLAATIRPGYRTPTYEDFENIGSFHDAMNATAEARENFERLPAALRNEFRNDPGLFVEFCLDEKNRARGIELGLIPDPKKASAGSPPPVPAATPSGASGEAK